MIEKYLHTSTKLKAVFLLIDIRHEPSENDCLMYEWMVEQGFAPIIIATKLDKISRGALPKHMQVIADTLHVEPDTIMIPFSAETKQGREDIWELIDSLVLDEDTDGVAGEGSDEEIQTNSVSDKNEANRKTDNEHDSIVEEKPRKQRWKSTGKETAKKTKKQQERKAAKQAKPGKKTKKK